ncbi:MAG TPA: sugar phosphate nucleotidyltransferase, partial [Bacteroidota bacterium]|nr:sugar phosphate nucleotidyltransferase [Bacteroidota bacterium]
DPVARAQTPFLGSMGIYVFSQGVLAELLRKYPQHTDFGNHFIPQAIKDYNVQAYVFKGYWEDIGTIEAFYKANMELVKQPMPKFSFYDDVLPIYTRPRFLPPTKMLDCTIEESMICDGCIIKKSVIRGSIVGIRSRIEDNTVIENTLIMGADYYQPSESKNANLDAGVPIIGIGANTVIRNAIIDKNAHVGKNVKILNKKKIQNIERENEGYWIRSGIVTVVKGAIIPDGTEI